MTDLPYPVLLAPQTHEPIYPADAIVCAGRRLSAASALTRYSQSELESFGYAFPVPADIRAVAALHVRAAADTALVAAARGYAWPEAAAWESLEAQARAYLEDPAGGAGPDLAADVGDTTDAAVVAARAESIVAKADLFRAARGAIVRARRAGNESLAAAEDVAAIKAAAAAAVTAIAAAA